MVTAGFTLDWTPPPGWWASRAGDVESGAWRSTLPEGGELFERDQARFAAFVAAHEHDRQAWLAVVGSVEGAPRITAAGWLDVRMPADLSELERRLQASVTSLPDGILTRQVNRVEVDGRAALTCLDLLGRSTDNLGAVIHERAFVAIAQPQVDALLLLDVSTTDLLGFDDLLGSVTAVAAGVQFIPKERQ